MHIMVATNRPSHISQDAPEAEIYCILLHFTQSQQVQPQ